MENQVLIVEKLSKRYGFIQAVKDLSLQVPRGSIFGLLGPNGSGKSTTLSMILGVVNPTAGEYRWFDGRNADESRKHIGALLEQPNFYPYLTAYQNLQIVAEIKKVSDANIDSVLTQVGMHKWRNHRFKIFSTGMKQRLAIASTLLADPEVLILDEPTNGLDPQGIREVRELIKDLGARGKTIILASHLLDEVEKVCTEVAVLRSGNLLEQRNIVSGAIKEYTIELAAADMGALENWLISAYGDESVGKKDNLLIVRTATIDPSELNKRAHDAGIRLNHLVKKHKSLEDQFFEITAN